MKQQPNPENQPDTEIEETVFEPQHHQQENLPPHEKLFEGSTCNCQRIFHTNKWWLLLLIFLAGMGFNELIHGGSRSCPSPQMPIHYVSAPLPTFTDGSGTMVVINTDRADVAQPQTHCNCRKHSKSDNYNFLKKPQQPIMRKRPSEIIPDDTFQENP